MVDDFFVESDLAVFVTAKELASVLDRYDSCQATVWVREFDVVGQMHDVSAPFLERARAPEPV